MDLEEELVGPRLQPLQVHAHETDHAAVRAGGDRRGRRLAHQPAVRAPQLQPRRHPRSSARVRRGAEDLELDVEWSLRRELAVHGEDDLRAARLASLGVDLVGEDGRRDAENPRGRDLDPGGDGAGSAARRVAEDDPHLGDAGGQQELPRVRAPAGGLPLVQGQLYRVVVAEPPRGVPEPGHDAHLDPGPSCPSHGLVGEPLGVELRRHEHPGGVAAPRLEDVGHRPQRQVGGVVRRVEGADDRRGWLGGLVVLALLALLVGVRARRGQRVAAARAHGEAGALHGDLQVPPRPGRLAFGGVEAEEVEHAGLLADPLRAAGEVVAVPDRETPRLVGQALRPRGLEDGLLQGRDADVLGVGARGHVGGAAEAGLAHEAPHVHEVDGGVRLAGHGGDRAATTPEGVVEESLRQEEEGLAPADGGERLEPLPDDPENVLRPAAPELLDLRRARPHLTVARGAHAEAERRPAELDPLPDAAAGRHRVVRHRRRPARQRERRAADRAEPGRGLVLEVRDAEGLVLAHPVVGRLDLVAAVDPGKQSAEVLEVLARPGGPPGVAAGGPEDDLVTLAHHGVEDGPDRAPRLLGQLGRDPQIVDDDGERPSRGVLAGRIRGHRRGLGRWRGRGLEDEGLEARDLQRASVLRHREVVLGEPGDRTSIPVENRRVHGDELHLRGEHGLLLGGSRRRKSERGEDGEGEGARGPPRAAHSIVKPMSRKAVTLAFLSTTTTRSSQGPAGSPPRLMPFVWGTGTPSFSWNATGSGFEAPSSWPFARIWACRTTSVAPFSSATGLYTYTWK